jgi:magnesium-protoporphyrin O-methyltransferase
MHPCFFHSRTAQAEAAGGNEKESVKAYFNEVGFDRWSRIYSDTDDVNTVQRDIRAGHAETVDKVLAWFDDRAAAVAAGETVCDAGCGTGSLAIPLALRGAAVTATDISAAMAGEAERRYTATVAAGAQAPPTPPTFAASCLEDVTGTYDTVCCIDVLIHYPQAQVDAMLAALTARATSRVVLSFAPSTPYFEALKRFGELFPKGAKATRAYLHKEGDVEGALARCGWTVVRKEMTGTKFYFSRLFEAVPTARA